MNNKGFISTTVLYSFFLVVLLILLFIVNDLVNNRISLNGLKEEIKEELSIDNLSRYLMSHNDELGLIRHDSTLNGGSGDNSYRYVGASPNNYVCFGSDATTCPSDNLYRIIGIFSGKVKIVKATSIGMRSANITDTNEYSSSSIYAYLNNEFLSSFSEEWQNAIFDNMWYVGGFASSVATNALNIYNYELGSNHNNIYLTNKIGLIYVSDYAYATETNNYNGAINANDNWLNNNQNTWFITRDNGGNTNYYYLTSSGTLASEEATTATIYVRPTFYLKSDLKFAGGEGTTSSPYRIEV